jgi:hypothetical protein
MQAISRARMQCDSGIGFKRLSSRTFLWAFAWIILLASAVHSSHLLAHDSDVPPNGLVPSSTKVESSILWFARKGVSLASKGVERVKEFAQSSIWQEIAYDFELKLCHEMAMNYPISRGEKASSEPSLVLEFESLAPESFKPTSLVIDDSYESYDRVIEKPLIQGIATKIVLASGAFLSDARQVARRQVEQLAELAQPKLDYEAMIANWVAGVEQHLALLGQRNKSQGELASVFGKTVVTGLDLTKEFQKNSTYAVLPLRIVALRPPMVENPELEISVFYMPIDALAHTDFSIDPDNIDHDRHHDSIDAPSLSEIVNRDSSQR